MDGELRGNLYVAIRNVHNRLHSELRVGQVLHNMASLLGPKLFYISDEDFLNQLTDNKELDIPF